MSSLRISTVMTAAFLSVLGSADTHASTNSLDLTANDGNHVIVPPSSALAPANLTVEAWAVPGASNPIRGTIVRRNPAFLSETYTLRFEFGKAQWGVKTSTGFFLVTAPNTSPPGVPVHLAGTYDGTRLVLYVNGIEVNDHVAFPGSTVDTGGPLLIGQGEAGNASEDFSGEIDQLRIWKVARTPLEIYSTKNQDAQIVSNDLIAEWDFDGDLNSSTGSHHGTWSVGASFGPESAPFKKTLDLVGGYVRVPAPSGLVPANGLTVEAEVMLTSTAAPRATIVRMNPAANSESYILRYDSGAIGFFVRTAFGSFSAGPVPMTLNEEHHVAATYDGLSIRIFLDGVEKASSFAFGPLVDGGGDLNIGRGESNDPNEQWHGTIDEVRIWNFARTESEIQSTIRTELDPIPGMIGAWHLNGDFVDAVAGNDGMPGTASGPNFLYELVPLAQIPARAFSVGSGTSTCPVAPKVAVGSPPLPGNTAASLLCVDAPSLTPGFMIYSLTTLPSAVKAVGIDYWLSGYLGIIPMTSAANGTVRLPVLVTPTTVGAVSVQFIWSDCGPFGYSASDALSLDIRP